MITKAGSPGGGQSSAPRLAEVCDSPKRGELGRAIFGSGELRLRYPPAKLMRHYAQIFSFDPVRELASSSMKL